MSPINRPPGDQRPASKWKWLNSLLCDLSLAHPPVSLRNPTHTFNLWEKAKGCACTCTHSHAHPLGKGRNNNKACLCVCTHTPTVHHPTPHTPLGRAGIRIKLSLAAGLNMHCKFASLKSLRQNERSSSQGNQGYFQEFWDPGFAGDITRSAYGKSALLENRHLRESNFSMHSPVLNLSTHTPEARSGHNPGSGNSPLLGSK